MSWATRYILVFATPLHEARVSFIEGMISNDKYAHGIPRLSDDQTGHLILSVTTRRAHRRSGLDARLTVPMGIFCISRISL